MPSSLKAQSGLIGQLSQAWAGTTHHVSAWGLPEFLEQKCKSNNVVILLSLEGQAVSHCCPALT